MAGSGSGWMFEPGSLDFPLVIAHRGAHSAHPENTIAAFQAALALGVDGVELDVRLTGDGQVAVAHDRAIEVGVGRGAVVGRMESPKSTRCAPAPVCPRCRPWRRSSPRCLRPFWSTSS